MAPPRSAKTVLYTIDSLGGGGAERSLVELLPRVIDGGFTPTVAAFRRAEEGYEDEVRAMGVDVLHVLGARARQLRQLRARISRSPPWLAHSTLFEADVLTRLAAAGTGVPVLTSLVNTSYDPSRRADRGVSPRRLALARALDGWSARHLASHHHAISQAVADASTVALGLDRDKITVIPRGRSTERLGEPSPSRRAAVRRSLGVAPDARLVLNVGRVEHQKGQVDLVRAMAPVLEEDPDCLLMLAGRPGNASPHLNQAIRATETPGQIRLLGFRNDIPDLLCASDVFAFPSLFEGLGGSVIEAMALGIPVVASDLPAIREVVGTTAAGMVPAGDVQGLGAAIAHVLVSPESAREGSRLGRRRFAENFTMEAIAPRMIDLYERVALRGRRGRVR